MTVFSHSRVECFNMCPYKYDLSYNQRLDTLPSDDANNALIVGSAMHLGIEKGVDAAIEYYKSQYNIMTNECYNELIKIETMIPKVEPLLNRANATFEYKLITDDFVGYIDYLEVDGKSVKIYDFKYSNAVERYLLSDQLHLYKYFFEKLNPLLHVDELGFIMIPKTSIKQTQKETIYDFRQRLTSTLESLEVKLVKVDYEPNRVIGFFENMKHVMEAEEFPKKETNFCRFCNFNSYCQKGLEYDLIHKK